MSNKNRYIKFDLPDSIVTEVHAIGQFIKESHEHFSPYEYNEIHMTVCFLGNLSKNLGSNDKKQKYDEIDHLIATFNKVPVSGLTFKSYQLFGANKNLLVATFDMSKADRDRIIAFKQQFVLFGAPAENYFTPHITIGKLQFGKPIDDNTMKGLPIITTDYLVNMTTIMN